MKITKVLLMLLLTTSHSMAFAEDSKASQIASNIKEQTSQVASNIKDRIKDLCQWGKEVLSINISSKDTEKVELTPIKTTYQASTGEIIAEGHILKIDLNDGGTATLPSGDYTLVQCHFHEPSKEKVDGKTFPLSAHLVHKKANDELAVIAILFKEGKENSTLKDIINNLPTKEGKIDLKAKFDASKLLPSTLDHYPFKGSLTTSSGTEEVAWYVLKDPMEASAAQIKDLSKFTK